MIFRCWKQNRTYERHVFKLSVDYFFKIKKIIQKIEFLNALVFILTIFVLTKSEELFKKIIDTFREEKRDH
jgi:hypothetical protein